MNSPAYSSPYRHLVVMLLAAAVSSGCVTAPSRPDSAPMSGDEQRLREQSEQISGTVMEGAVVGAVIGGLIGALAGGDAKAAALGAGAGALAGAAGGYYVAKRQQHYASEEARTEAMIADVRKDNDQLREYVLTARRVIDSDKQRIADIEQRYSSDQIDLAEARERLGRVRENREVIAETLDGLEKKKEEYAYAAEQTRMQNPGTDLSKLNAEIQTLEVQIAMLERDLGSLDEALEVTRIG